MRFTSPHTIDEASGKIVPKELPSDGTKNISLRFDDAVSENGRTEHNTRWADITVLPGDTLHATVSGLTDLVVSYRREGWAGVLERREVTIPGHE